MQHPINHSEFINKTNKPKRVPDFSLGQEVKIMLKRDSGRKAIKKICGPIIYMNKSYITVKDKHYTTGIQISDFQEGAAVLI